MGLGAGGSEQIVLCNRIQSLLVTEEMLWVSEERYITDNLDDIETHELKENLPDYFDFNGDVTRTAYLN